MDGRSSGIKQPSLPPLASDTQISVRPEGVSATAAGWLPRLGNSGHPVGKDSCCIRGCGCKVNRALVGSGCASVAVITSSRGRGAEHGIGGV